MTINGREFISCVRCSGAGVARSAPGKSMVCFLCNKEGAIPIAMAVEIALLGFYYLSQARVADLRQRHGVVPRIWVQYEWQINDDIDFRHTSWSNTMRGQSSVSVM